MIGNTLTGAANLFSSLFNAFSSIGQAKREKRNQKELMRYQDAISDENYQQELADKKELIADDRQYQSISSQMNRARNAGISPLAALGVSSGNSISASTPTHSAPSVPSAPTDSLTAVASSLRQAVMETSQLQMMQKQQEKMDVEMATERLRQVEQTYDNVIKQIEAEGYSEKFAEEINSLKASVRRLSSQAKLDETQIQFNLESMESRLSEAKNRANLVGEQAQTEKDIRLSRINQMDSQTAYNRAQSALAKFRLSHGERYGEDLPNGGINSAISKLVNVVFGETGDGQHDFEGIDTSTPMGKIQAFWAFGHKVGIAPALLALIGDYVFGEEK